MQKKPTNTIAQALLKISAVGFNPDQPFRFKSGMLSPVYVDNRRLPFHPTEWKIILDGFSQLITAKKLRFDCIAGIETAGIPHSAALGLTLQKPSIFVRKKPKEHGTKKGVEGGDVSEKQVLLLEDHVSTGLSSLTGVENLRSAGAHVTDCIAITKYAFPEATRAFAEKNVNLHTLTTFEVILDCALDQKLLTAAQRTSVESWLADPWKWTRHHE